MTKQQAKDIGEILTCVSGNNFDSIAFQECNLNEKDTQKILDELQKLNSKRIVKVLKKYGIVGYADLSSTRTIVETIIYE